MGLVKRYVIMADWCEPTRFLGRDEEWHEASGRAGTFSFDELWQTPIKQFDEVIEFHACLKEGPGVELDIYWVDCNGARVAEAVLIDGFDD